MPSNTPLSEGCSKAVYLDFETSIWKTVFNTFARGVYRVTVPACKVTIFGAPCWCRFMACVIALSEASLDALYQADCSPPSMAPNPVLLPACSDTPLTTGFGPCCEARDRAATQGCPPTLYRGRPQPLDLLATPVCTTRAHCAPSGVVFGTLTRT